MKKGCQGHGAVLRQEIMLKGLRMHPIGTLCCYLTGIALRRTFLWRVIQAGSWRKVGQILRSWWVNGQLSREQDKEGPGIKRLWFWITYRTWKPCKVGVDWSFSLYLSYQFKISSELEILWDRLLEVCVAVYTWILWELWVEIKVGMRQAHVYILVERTLGFLWDERT